MPDQCERDVAVFGQVLKQHEFDQISRLAYERFGLALKDGKQALVTARLGKKLRELNFRSFEQYYRHVLEDKTGEALLSMIDALTTNFTSFMREPAHFAFLTDVMWPVLRTRREVWIWSAACATGEEPYSILFSLLAQPEADLPGKVRVLATDISGAALKKAEAGIYSDQQVRLLPPSWQPRYFLRGEDRWSGRYRVKPELRRAVEFQRLNLVESGALSGVYPLIFCRNVMIYFDKPTQERVVRRLTGALEPGGYLFIGHAESLMGINHDLVFVRPGIYRKPNRAA